jgi:hypothetical protein
VFVLESKNQKCWRARSSLLLGNCTKNLETIELVENVKESQYRETLSFNRQDHEAQMMPAQMWKQRFYPRETYIPSVPRIDR